MSAAYWLAAEADGIAAPVLPIAPEPLLVEPMVLGDEAIASGVVGVVVAVDPVLLPVVPEVPDVEPLPLLMPPPVEVPEVSASFF